jgi:hypothetical protein
MLQFLPFTKEYVAQLEFLHFMNTNSPLPKASHRENPSRQPDGQALKEEGLEKRSEFPPSLFKRRGREMSSYEFNCYATYSKVNGNSSPIMKLILNRFNFFNQFV